MNPNQTPTLPEAPVFPAEHDAPDYTELDHVELSPHDVQDLEAAASLTDEDVHAGLLEPSPAVMAIEKTVIPASETGMSVEQLAAPAAQLEQTVASNAHLPGTPGEEATAMPASLMDKMHQLGTTEHHRAISHNSKDMITNAQMNLVDLRNIAHAMVFGAKRDSIGGFLTKYK